jgi:hypothetical protein
MKSDPMTIEKMRDVENTLLALIERVDAMKAELRRGLNELDKRFDEYLQRGDDHDHQD